MTNSTKPGVPTTTPQRYPAIATKSSKYKYTSQKAVRAAFWAAHPGLSRKKIPDYSGHGKMHPTDVRCAFSDFVDMLSKDGSISPNMVQNVTLS